MQKEVVWIDSPGSDLILLSLPVTKRALESTLCADVLAVTAYLGKGLALPQMFCVGYRHIPGALMGQNWPVLAESILYM